MARKQTNKSPYLTKRRLVSAARSGVRIAAKETMKIIGYNIVARDGWVVRLFPDGRIERISQIDTTENLDVVLD